MLQEVATIVTPDTILRWHREFVAAKWNYSGRRNKIGRPPTPDEIVELILRMARENPTWGYDRIQGALANLGHEISDTTVQPQNCALADRPNFLSLRDELLATYTKELISFSGAARSGSG